jgi:hypothetical protein
VTGFVAFEMIDIEACAAIAWQVASALRSERMYRKAVERESRP